MVLDNNDAAFSDVGEKYKTTKKQLYWNDNSKCNMLSSETNNHNHTDNTH